MSLWVGQEVQALPRPTGLNRLGHGVLALCLLLWPAAGLAAEVTLSTPEGQEVVSGELLGFDGRYYRLMTEAGEVSVDADTLVCAGDCPGPDTVPVLRISAEPALSRRLLRPLIEIHARRRGLDLAIAPDGAMTLADGDAAIGRIVVADVTSDEVFADIVGDTADLGLTIRPVTAGEVRLAADAGRGNLAAPGRSAILALDALVAVTSVVNPVDRVSLAQLRDVLGGRITDWADLGGAPGPIRLHLPAERSGLDQAVGHHLATDAAGAVRHDDLAALAESVAADPDALGLTTFDAVGATEPLALGGACGARLAPSRHAIKTQDYPLTLPILLYAPARRLPDFARDFVDFATSPAAQSSIARAGFVDQFPERQPLAAQGDRLTRAILAPEAQFPALRRMVGRLAGHDRLSLSFRFENGSTALDAPSRSNVVLLAEAIDRGLFDDQALLFAGFSDAAGPVADNRALSRLRADTVATSVRDASIRPGPPFDVAGFGEALPIACEDSEEGRLVNRRVEVWIGPRD